MLAFMTSIAEAWAGGRAARSTRPARTPVLVVIARTLAALLPTWGRTRRVVLQVGGFAFLDFTAYQWSHLAGYAAIGISLLIVEWLTSGGDGK